ncbi:RNA-directed DNA polymerase, eukaryota, reverse transcriptase zinc-binding domain protein [Tanacetum coccineum]
MPPPNPINRDRDLAEAPGANNDLTILNHSPLFDDLLDDIAPIVEFEVNGVTFEKGYYLADGIYPQRATFVKSFTVARDEKNAVVETASEIDLDAVRIKERQRHQDELDELLEIFAMIDSRLENIDHDLIVVPPPYSPEQLLQNFLDPPEYLEIDDIISDIKSVDTPLVYYFLDSNDESDNGEVVNDIYLNEEYFNRQINRYSERDLAFPCMIGFRKFVACFDPNLSMSIITRKAINIIMVNQLASRDDNFVGIVKNVHVFVESVTYTIDFIVFEDIEKYIEIGLSEVVMGKPFKDLTHLDDDCRYHQWSKVPPLLVLSDGDKISELKYPYEKYKWMYKGCLKLGPEYQIDEDMKEWLTRGHVILDKEVRKFFGFSLGRFLDDDLTGSSCFFSNIEQTRGVLLYLAFYLSSFYSFCGWRLWIQSCLRSSRGSIIVNGSPTEEFQFFKGLKQGDPLSPFLFILIMESLHLSFQRVVDAGMYTGIKLCSSLNLSHLFYADDVMFVGQWCDSNINTLVHALECFHRASGLKINMSKSKILGIHVEAVKVKQAASKLGCLILNTPFSYLVPSSVLQRLESIRSRFFKGHDLGSNKASWVKWSNVLMPKEKGGLGVSSLYALNRGLLFKWVWKFYAQKTSLWARVIKAIHGVDGKVGKAINSGASSCWTSIVREVEVLKQQGVNFFEYLQLNMGNGESTTFWEDRWLEGSVLKDIFPRLYVLETNKKVSISDKLKDFRLDSLFRQKARGGIEQVQYEELSDMVNSISLTPKNDRYVWSLSNPGDFSVTSFRKVIDENRYPGGRFRTRWVKYVPIKVNVTAWKIKMDALPTRLNISRRGMDIQSLSCPICDCGVESSSHLFFQCNLVRQVVRKISSWWNIDYVDVNSYEEWLIWLISLRLTAKLKVVLEEVFYVLWWSIWSFCNKLLFESKNPSKAVIFDNVVSCSYYWCKFRCKASFSWTEWLKNPYLVTL